MNIPNERIENTARTASEKGWLHGAGPMQYIAALAGYPQPSAVFKEMARLCGWHEGATPGQSTRGQARAPAIEGR